MSDLPKIGILFGALLRDFRLVRASVAVYGRLIEQLDFGVFREILVPRVAASLGLSESTVVAAIEQLTDCGYLDRNAASSAFRLVWSFSSPGGARPPEVALTRPLPVTVSLPNVDLAGPFPVIADGARSLLGETIYGLVDPREPTRIRYVGRTAFPVLRMRQHLRAGASLVRDWVTSLRQWRVDPLMLELARVAETDADTVERAWIDRLHQIGMADLNTVGRPMPAPPA